MTRAAALLLCLFAPALVGAAGNEAREPAPAGSERVALVIGNSRYERIESLRNPGNDARDVAEALASFGFKVTLAVDFKRTEMRRVIRDFTDGAKKEQIAFFYYAGHGAQVQGTNYLLPVDADVRDARDIIDQGVDAGEILGRLGQAGARIKIMVLDACRNLPVPASAASQASLSAKNGLAAIDAPVNAFVAFATAPGGVAADGRGRNGVYTEHFLKALRAPDTTIEAVFKRTMSSVVTATVGTQIPWVNSSLFLDFAFGGAAVRPDGVTTALATTAALASSLESTASQTPEEADVLATVQRVMQLRREGNTLEEAKVLEAHASRIEHLDLLRHLASAYRRSRDFRKLAAVSERIVGLHASDLDALDDLEQALRQLGDAERAHRVQQAASFVRSWNGGRLFRPFILVSPFGLLPNIDARFVGTYELDPGRRRLRVAFREIEVKIAGTFLDRYRISPAELRVTAGPAAIAGDGRHSGSCDLGVRYEASTQSITFRSTDPAARVICDFALGSDWNPGEVGLVAVLEVVRSRAIELARAPSGALVP